jgi:osmotically-inducible protein OsmY
MRSDADIRADVEAELSYDPNIGASDIAISVKDGVVTLAGFVKSYFHRWQAERDTKRVKGVRGVANDIEIRLPALDARPDPEIAREAVQALSTALPYSGEKFTVTVKDGRVTLEGEAEWQYQREQAEAAVRRIRGIKSVVNSIQLQPKVPVTAVKRMIEDALKRSAEVDAQNIAVEAEGDKVILKGKVRSWAERQEAERAAWRAPGVRKVEDEITVSVF